MKLLFICTHNRCRSILSEAITNHLAKGRIQAFSAGSQPVGEVHPWSICYLAARGIPTTGLTSQSWNLFDTLNPDAVITVCDSAANESCPLWMGNGIKVHWGLPDPSKLDGPESEVEQAFSAVMDTIQARIQAILDTGADALKGDALRDALNRIAQEH
ncbi:arsenate reductase ArsC [Microbulbifer sp. SA54]|uniref:arsenate reductase ArsC n=1 Tax=Microbulbifer sp. SA54 TaxID=3401577 RepID=UPI003AAD6D04